MKPEYSVVVVHGIGAGKGEERRGFSKKLKQQVAKVYPDIDAYWQEAPWEGVNDEVDSVVHSVVNELLDEYDTTAVVRTRSAEIRQGYAWLHSIAVFITRTVKRIGRWMEKLRRALAPCLLWCARKAVPNLLDALIDLPLYLTRGKGNTIREEVRKCIAEAVDKTGKGVILVGHSLGSVIAFDVLAETIAEGTYPAVPERRHSTDRTGRGLQADAPPLFIGAALRVSAAQGCGRLRGRIQPLDCPNLRPISPRAPYLCRAACGRDGRRKGEATGGGGATMVSAR